MRSVGKGTVEARGKGKWRLRVSVSDDRGNRQRLNRNVECRTKTEANRALDKWRNELLTSSETLVVGNLTFEEYLYDHLSFLHDVKKVSPNTLRGYRDIVRNRWIPRLGELPVASITSEVVEKQLAWMSSEGGSGSQPLSGNTCQKAFSFLKTAMKRALRLGYIKVNPCDLLDGPSKSKAQIVVLDEDEVNRMRVLSKGHPDYRFAMAILLALDTGMRRGELCGLLWKDVDLKNKRLHVCRALAEASASDTYNGTTLQEKEPKSDTSDRWITLYDSTVEALKQHAERQYYRLKYFGCEQTPDTPVFCGDLGEPYRPSKLTSDFVRFAQQHKFEITLHGLRHTHATILLKHGIPIDVVAQRLGHENVSITYRFYRHYIPGEDGGAAEAYVISTSKPESGFEPPYAA